MKRTVPLTDERPPGSGVSERTEKTSSEVGPGEAAVAGAMPRSGVRHREGPVSAVQGGAVSAGEEIRRQETLRAFVESISSELQVRPLLDRILRHSLDLVGADKGSVGLVKADGDRVRVESECCMPEGEMGMEYMLGEGLAGLVFAGGETVALDDHEAPGRSSVGTALGVPIRSSAGSVTGTICVSRDSRQGDPARAFSTRDARTLEIFARHAAIAIENARRYLREQERAERLALIARIGNLMTANVDLDEILQRAADAMYDLLGYSMIGIGLLEDGDPPVLAMGATSGQRTYPFAKPLRWPITEGVIGAAVRERRTILVEDVSLDPRYMPAPNAVGGITCMLVLPILLGSQVLGVLNIESDEPFDDEDPGSLQIVADQLAVAIEASRLYQAGQDLAALQERQRLSRELHDSVTQHLFGTVMLAESLGEVWAADPERGAERTRRLLELSRSALAEMRSLLSELRDDGPGRGSNVAFGIQRVRAHGLVAALERLGADASVRGLPVVTDATNYASQPTPREEALYRIVQEALSNVVKHASAGSAEVGLAVSGGRVLLTVTDDGVGMLEGAPERTGLGETTMGLDSMRERAEALGGSFRVGPGPRGGCQVVVDVPTA